MPAMEMRSLPPAVALAWVLGTYAVLLTALWLTSRVAPITF